ncbi:MAG: helix-turn-helix domain-containing protein, partial [Lachnospiraceae bacterium]|nr:helix-turn-helix domain-containing protein [Lachnospiraceae bacterium]
MGSLNNLGSNIAGLRKKSDITQDQLAEQLGVSVSAVSQWENGRTMPDISAIPVLCHIFNVSSDELLGIDREKDEEEIKRINDEANRLVRLVMTLDRSVSDENAHKLTKSKCRLEDVVRGVVDMFVKVAANHHVS